MPRASRDGAPERDPQRIEVGVHRDLAHPVEAIDRPRRVAERQVGDVADTHHPAARGGHEDVAHRRRIVAKRLVQPEPHAVLLVAVLELRHFLAADERAHGRRQGIHRHAEIRRPLAVDVNPQLRLRCFEARVGIVDAVDLLHLREQRVRIFLQLVDVRALHDHRQPVAAAAPTRSAAPGPAATTAASRCAGNVGAARHADAGIPIFAQRAPGHLHQLLLGQLALIERRQLDRIVAAAVLDRGHHRLEIGPERLAELAFDRRHVLERPLEARASRQPQVHAELALVVVRHQLLADVGIEDRPRRRR